MSRPTTWICVRRTSLKTHLLQYDGTLIIVSHDRDFLQGLTNRVFEFRNRKIREYIGDIYDFLEQRKLDNLSSLEARGKEKKEEQEIISGNKQNWEKKKEFDKEMRKLRNQVAKCESGIETLESELRKKEEMLAIPRNMQPE